MAKKTALKHLPLESIRANPYQPRKSFTRRQLDELKDSIRAVGLIQPIVVRPLDNEEDQFEIVAGERRYRVFTELQQSAGRKFSLIPAIVHSRPDDEAAMAALIENIARADLNPIERAEALKALRKLLRTTWDGVAKKVGLSKRAILFSVGNLKLRREIKDAIASGTLKERHGRALRRLSKTPDLQFDLFEYVIAHGLNSDDTAAIAAMMVKYAGTTAEAAHGRIKNAGENEKLPRLRTGPPSTPYKQAIRGLRTFMHDTVKGLNVAELNEDESAVLEQLLADTQERLSELQNALGGGKSIFRSAT